MRIAVIYGTKSGCTAGIAEKIGETLSALGHTADVVSVGHAGSAAEYDAVILGSGVRVGTWHQDASKWASQNADALKTMPVALFTCGLTITDASKADEVRAYTDGLIESTGMSPVDVGLFAGWNEPKQFSFLERTVLKVMKAPEGDFRDFEAIASWTRTVAPKLTAS